MAGARAGIRDVAEKAGVSVTTVSLVLNGRAGANIPPETQARVLAAAESLRYRPNSLARGLRRKRTDTFGLISDEIATTPFAGALIQGAQDAAWEAGVVLLIANTGHAAALEARAIDVMLERRVDAMIYAALFHQVIEPPPAIRELPAVLLDARAKDASLPSVVPDEAGGAEAAVTLLIRSGHRRIGFVNSWGDLPAAGERFDGYRRALTAHGIAVDPALVAHVDHTVPPAGDEGAARLLDRDDPPTALFCFNDRLAMGAYRAIRHRSLRIPDDISVVGFDNQEQIAAWLDPGLTTVQLPHYEMGCWAVEHLVVALQSSTDLGDPPVQRREPCPLVERASVGGAGRP
jgi:LacI family transcriptional regulator